MRDAVFFLLGIVGVLLLASLALPAGPLPCATPRHDIPVAVQRRVFSRAGLVWKKVNPKWVIDHIIPLELCGSDTEDNMQVQSVADGRAKDRVENYLQRRVEAGTMSLTLAQELIKDWRHVYPTVPRCSEVHNQQPCWTFGEMSQPGS